MDIRDPLVVLYVHDMERALAFWEHVGFRIVDTSADWSRLAGPGVDLGLHGIYRGVSERPARHAGLNLAVDDLETALRVVRAAGGRLKCVREPEPRVPVRLAEVEDSEGNGFELRQEVAS